VQAKSTRATRLRQETIRRTAEKKKEAKLREQSKILIRKETGLRCVLPVTWFPHRHLHPSPSPSLVFEEDVAYHGLRQGIGRRGEGEGIDQQFLLCRIEVVEFK
jgi:hypothetical protein